MERAKRGNLNPLKKCTYAKTAIIKLLLSDDEAIQVLLCQLLLLENQALWLMTMIDLHFTESGTYVILWPHQHHPETKYYGIIE